MDEPRFTSTRTDAATEADRQLATIPGIKRIDAARQGSIRDALRQAFDAGEHQGECRAIRILAIAQANARTAETRAALAACLALLVGEPE